VGKYSQWMCHFRFGGNIILSSFFGLMDPENIGVALEIAFLSCLQAEICASSFSLDSFLRAAILDFLLPVYSRFRLVVQYYNYPYVIVGSRKHRYSRLNLVENLCTS